MRWPRSAFASARMLPVSASLRFSTAWFPPRTALTLRWSGEALLPWPALLPWLPSRLARISALVARRWIACAPRLLRQHRSAFADAAVCLVSAAPRLSGGTASIASNERCTGSRPSLRRLDDRDALAAVFSRGSELWLWHPELCIVSAGSFDPARADLMQPRDSVASRNGAVRH